MPEDIIGTPPSDAPVYGTVLHTTGATATVKTASEPCTTVEIPGSLVRERSVPAHEYAGGAPGEWLRKPVVGVAQGVYVYGQVTGYHGTTADVRTGLGLMQSDTSALVEIAPVVCFLRGWSRTSATEVTPATLNDQHHTILDRLFGTNGERATRAISRLLRGFTAPRDQPQPTDTLRWVNATSGATRSVSVRHAIDFAYYVDGQRRAPPRIRSTIGSRFDDDPEHPPAAAASVARPADLATDDRELEALLDSIDRPTPQAERSEPVPSSAPPSPSATNHAKVLAAIGDDPDLIRFYLGLCQTSSSKRPASASDARDSQRRRLESPADLIDDAAASARRPKHAFTPTQPQQQVNAMIVSALYEGKDAAILVDIMISSRATKFKPHPAIIVRIYAFEFGARGLSILHFRRFDFAARRSWYAEGSVNLNNFSASVALPKAPRPSTIDDISSALTVMHVFVEEFFEDITRRLVSAAREFVEELNSFCRWTPQDVDSLVFWFDRVFEDYRAATLSDARTGGELRADVQAKFSIRDPELQSVLYVIQSERLISLSNTSAPRLRTTTAPTNDGARAQRPPRKTPREVIEALPTKEGLSVCMKYLSRRGCSSKSDDRCAFPNHAHFLPDELAPVSFPPCSTVYRLPLPYSASEPKSARRHTRPDRLARGHAFSALPPSSQPSTAQFRVSGRTAAILQLALRARLSASEQARRTNIVRALQSAGVTVPTSLTSTRGEASPRIDSALCSALSQLVIKSKLTLDATVALWRHETEADPRPNKALDPTWLDILLHGYEHREQVVSVASHGVSHTFHDPRPPDPMLLANHSSVRQFGAAVERSIGEGQANGTYLVLAAPVALAWAQLRLSPFGCVPKKDTNISKSGRLIHDLSYPRARSTNACSTQADIPDITFESVCRIARRIEHLAIAYPGRTIKLLKGDVKSAFRRIAVAAAVSAHFAGSHGGDMVVIDLALPFGWTGSPAYYGIFGGAISFLISRESPHSLDPDETDTEPFFSYVWVDDHLLVEIERENRLGLAEAALRLSMLATLGPDAINEQKFSPWSTVLVVLGLLWDTNARTVSMPPDKVAKALSRLRAVVAAARASRHQLEKLLGSLPYVSLCYRSARAFFQRLQALWRVAPRFGSALISPSVLHDLQWVESLLLHDAMNGIPTSLLAGTSAPDVHLFMDASDSGLAVLYPAIREFFRVQFDSDEAHALRATPEFSINTRELLSAVLAVLVWGPVWKGVPSAIRRPIHVRCWIDNLSATTWVNRHRACTTAGQELLRVLSCAEVEFRLHVSAAHIPGSRNTLADLGSRAWSGGCLRDWTNKMSLWCEQAVPPHFRKIYNGTWSFCNGGRSPTRPGATTWPPGSAGVPSARGPASPAGYPPTTRMDNPYNSLFSQLAAGASASRQPLSGLAPYGLSSAISNGVISSLSDSVQDSSRNTNSSYKGCAGSAHHDTTAVPYPSTCSEPSPPVRTSPAPSTASFVGLRCWASTFVSAGQNTYRREEEDTATACKFKT